MQKHNDGNYALISRTETLQFGGFLFYGGGDLGEYRDQASDSSHRMDCLEFLFIIRRPRCGQPGWVGEGVEGEREDIYIGHWTVDNDGDKVLVRIPGQCDLPFEGQGQSFCIVGRGRFTLWSPGFIISRSRGWSGQLAVVIRVVMAFQLSSI